jgi:hypothetical protein
MAQEDKDLCKTCEHYWVDFEVIPDKKYVAHCEILDAKQGLKELDEEVPYPCLDCPFKCYIKKNK